jgi:hypothetical protein
MARSHRCPRVRVRVRVRVKVRVRVRVRVKVRLGLGTLFRKRIIEVRPKDGWLQIWS